MNEEKIKKIFLVAFILIIMGATIWGIIHLTYSPIKDLRSNKTEELNSYKENTDKQIKDNSKNQNNNISNVDITISQTLVEENSKNLQKQESEIATYSTTIYDTEEARIHNIKLATEKLNETIIEPAKEFSFNETIGPMGQKQGYQKATGFNGNGKKIKIYGGGMCQISSTLYNAALICNFEITERHPHSKRVYYVPKDKDATVSYGGADLKFINTKENPVKILATTDGHDVTIKLIEIIG